MVHLSHKHLAIAIIVFSCCFAACKKEPVTYENNQVPPYSEISTIKVNNYVNRLYIDLIGREPTDEEMDRDVSYLESHNLTIEARAEIANTLIYDTDFIAGDSSYTNAYFTKLYEDTKARIIEGASDAEIEQEYNTAYNQAQADSLAGNASGYEQNMKKANRLLSVLNSRTQLRDGEITIREMYERMLHNSIYDLINMGSFNFINATFNDLLYRFPTDAEFDQAFEIIEYNQPAQIFGAVAQDKAEYIDIITSSAEYEEGMVRWAYLSLLSREATTQEISDNIQNIASEDEIQSTQIQILITDEYAGFEN